MTISDAAVIAAAEYVSRSIYGQDGAPDAGDLHHGRELVLRIAPHILAAERTRVASKDPTSLIIDHAGEAGVFAGS